MNQTTNSTVDQKITMILDSDLKYSSFDQKLQQEYEASKEKGFVGTEEEYLTYRDYT